MSALTVGQLSRAYADLVAEQTRTLEELESAVEGYRRLGGNPEDSPVVAGALHLRKLYRVDDRLVGGRIHLEDVIHRLCPESACHPITVSEYEEFKRILRGYIQEIASDVARILLMKEVAERARDILDRESWRRFFKVQVSQAPELAKAILDQHDSEEKLGRIRSELLRDSALAALERLKRRLDLYDSRIESKRRSALRRKLGSSTKKIENVKDIREGSSASRVLESVHRDLEKPLQELDVVQLDSLREVIDSATQFEMAHGLEFDGSERFREEWARFLCRMGELSGEEFLEETQCPQAGEEGTYVDDGGGDEQPSMEREGGDDGQGYPREDEPDERVSSVSQGEERETNERADVNSGGFGSEARVEVGDHVHVEYPAGSGRVIVWDIVGRSEAKVISREDRDIPHVQAIVGLRVGDEYTFGSGRNAKTIRIIRIAK